MNVDDLASWFDFSNIGYLALELVPYLTVAAVIGFVTGWLSNTGKTGKNQ